MNISRTKQGLRVSAGRGLPTAASCLPRCARPGVSHKGHVTASSCKSGQALKQMTEFQNWIQDKFGFLRLHIRCKGLSKFSGFKSLAQRASASAALAHDISRASTDTDSMEISMQSIDTSLQPQQVTSPTVGHSSVDQRVMNQLTQMRTMLTSFLGQKQETTHTAFYNYLASEVEGLEARDF